MTAANKAGDAAAAAKQLEAFFLRRLLAEARPAGAGIDGGFAGDTFKQMLDEAIADKMSGAGGVGMAQMFAAQLGGGSASETAVPGAFGSLSVAGAHGAAGPLPHGTTSLHGHSIADPGAHGPAIPGLDDGLVSPLSGARATSGFGIRHDHVKGTEVNHGGFDLAAKTGTPVGAAAAGTVTHAGPAGTYGNLVIVEHANGYSTRYAHLSKVGVQKGQHVEPHTHVGDVGSTGYSTGPHLHFEVRKDGKAIDPEPLLPPTSGITKPLNAHPGRSNR